MQSMNKGEHLLQSAYNCTLNRNTAINLLVDESMQIIFKFCFKLFCLVLHPHVSQKC